MFIELPSALNSNFAPVKANGDVLLRSVVSHEFRQQFDTKINKVDAEPFHFPAFEHIDNFVSCSPKIHSQLPAELRLPRRCSFPAEADAGEDRNEYIQRG